MYFVAMVRCLGTMWGWRRARARLAGGGGGADGHTAATTVKVLGLSTVRPGVTLLGVRHKDQRRVVPAKERRAARTWRTPARTVAAVTLGHTELPDRLTPADFGLEGGAVIAEADGVKYFYGAEDDLTAVLRR